ncbi:hypothetical protein [Caldimonas tepidiphila]|uniref:hypothetical protein n=1 Tax=Caldimonas tepidiphila TaxID=2315841 RepID=UPI0013006223|nr:hypothetical protein [Caldimonas tepidiphila]
MHDVERARQQETLSRTLQRSRDLTLPDDRRHAIGQALAFVRGRQTYDGPAALDELRDRVGQYVDPASPRAVSELAEHLPILEALWLRFAAESTSERNADTRAKLLRMALQAQQGYARTLALVQGMTQQQRQQARVLVHEND